MSDLDSDRTIDSDELEQVIRTSKNKKQTKGSRKAEKPVKEEKKTVRKTHEISDSESDESVDGDTELFPDSPTPELKSTPIEVEEKPKQDLRPKCKYGKNCYRKNPDHLKMFSHAEGDSSCSSSLKRKTTDEMSSSGHKSQKLPPKGNIFNFFLTKVAGIPSMFNEGVSYHIKDLLSPSMGKLKASVQFNYMFDIPWLMDQYPDEFRRCPLTIVHGEQRQSKQALELTGEPYPNIKFCQAKLEIQYGTHHTKMMILLYDSGLRIVIHTSNIVENDWHQKTQGMWVSPVFPLLNGKSAAEGDSPTKFKADMIEYLSSYRAKELEEWIEIIKQHDMSKAKVFLIGSVPGRHMGARKVAFGHLKLRKVLTGHGPMKSIVTPDWPVVGQFSSIGSLGSSPDQWMRSEWATSLSTVLGPATPSQPPSLKLIFPSVENVRLSLEGYPAGASLPYSINVAQRQPYLRDFLHQWKSDWIGRSEACPHIKTYLRLSPDNKKIAWFLVTSANLSKAAWGALEKKESQLMIRSYELGVLFLPQYFGQQLFSVPNSGLGKQHMPFPVPYDIPLSPYRNKEEPWIWDIPHVYAPDRNGNKWCPQL